MGGHSWGCRAALGGLLSTFRRTQDPIFDKFLNNMESPPARLKNIDFVGSWIRPEFVAEGWRQFPVWPPPVDEEYFEWIDVISAALHARDSFVMLELGAGYGRWGVRGALAAKALGIPKIVVGFAEAEPTHLAWLKQHVADNGLAPEEVVIWECAVSSKAGKTLFYTRMPEGRPDNSPRDWYGQSIIKDYEKPVEDAEGSLDGTVRFTSGWAAVEVALCPAAELLAPFERIDLVDMDVQGAEVDVVSSAIDAFNAKVMRLHIGTHSTEIEEQLRTILGKNDWLAIRDFGCNGIRRTPQGKVSFVDGVQSWVNHRFIRTRRASTTAFSS
jgi:FkbM family methyltransferase